MGSRSRAAGRGAAWISPAAGRLRPMLLAVDARDAQRSSRQRSRLRTDRFDTRRPSWGTFFKVTPTGLHCRSAPSWDCLNAQLVYAESVEAEHGARSGARTRHRIWIWPEPARNNRAVSGVLARRTLKGSAKPRWPADQSSKSLCLISGQQPDRMSRIALPKASCSRPVYPAVSRCSLGRRAGQC